MFIEIGLVLLLICLNGVLAMSELAIVSARPARLRLKEERGLRGAGTALALAADPGRFLSTVQIGITLVGVLAGAFSGATIGARLAAWLPEIGVPVAFADGLGVGLVVIVITYLSLIVGELVPKQIALAAPERVAVRVAPAMMALSRIAAPLVWILDRSGKLLLRLIGQSGRRDDAPSDEDIRMLLSEAAGAGVIHRAERDMIGGVMRFSDRKARGLMTPRHEVEIADAAESRAEILERFARSGHSRLPVRQGSADEIIGILHSRDLLATIDEGFDVPSLMRAVTVVQDTLSAHDVVDKLRDAPGHMLLVYDEYGHFDGIITPMDVLGAIAGGFDEHEMDEPKLVRRKDGSLLVAGWMPIDELADRIGLVLPETRDFDTVAGFVLHLKEDLPETGDSVEYEGWRFEIADMDGRRIDRLLVAKRDAGD